MHPAGLTSGSCSWHLLPTRSLPSPLQFQLWPEDSLTDQTGCIYRGDSHEATSPKSSGCFYGPIVPLFILRWGFQVTSYSPGSLALAVRCWHLEVAEGTAFPPGSCPELFPAVRESVAGQVPCSLSSRGHNKCFQRHPEMSQGSASGMKLNQFTAREQIPRP